MQWLKNKNGKYIPCKDNLVAILPNNYSTTTYLDLSGKIIRGIEHPNGWYYGYETNFVAKR